MRLFVLFTMIFFHIVDDYYLQGILAKMKQRKWWEENAPDKMYRYDYIVALIAHAFSWSFIITVPTLLVSNKYSTMCIFMIINTIIHAYVDHQKANRRCINLFVDQLCHIIQIIGLWMIVLI